MDDVDLAQRHMEQEEEYRRKAVRPTQELERTGFCHWCGEPVQLAAVFCNKECSDERERNVRFRNLGH